MPLPAFVESLLDPSSYPDGAKDVRLLQTHISYVLVAGDLVYKIKKPVDFGFLDFTTIDKRRFFCDEEVRLNRRLCPSIYLGVVPVTERDGGFRFGGEGEPADWAVKMKRLPQERMMDELVARGEATPAMLEHVARVLAEFHAAAEAGPTVAAHGGIETIRTNTEENFTQTATYIDIALTRRRYEFIEAYARRFLANEAAFLARRVATGRIREGHGDLHLSNICYTDEPYIYDCIEFNERFRSGDVASEVAFLAMDLDFHGRPDLAHAFVDAYVDASGDGDLYQLLDFYKCYRAYVRGKVCSFELDEPEVDERTKRFGIDEARLYFDLAYRYAGGKVRPSLVVMCGPSGTGKSYLADALAEQLGLVVIRSDVVRKRLAGLASTTRRKEAYGAGIYSEEMTERTYGTLADDAARLMAAGHSVLLDASFLARRQRDLARETAEAAEARFLLVECTAPEEEVRKRLGAREKDETAVSDATLRIYLEQKERFEPPTEIDGSERIAVDTAGDTKEAARLVSARLAETGPVSPARGESGVSPRRVCGRRGG